MKLQVGTEMGLIEVAFGYLSRNGRRFMQKRDYIDGAHRYLLRYYAKTTNTEWPPEVHDYNKRFTQTLEAIKKRHDPTVTTVAQGVLEWKRNQKAQNIGLDVQAWLDRFYMSRIGIRFLIGQRRFIPCIPSWRYLTSDT